MRFKYKKLIIIFTLAIMFIGMGTFSMIAPNVEVSLGKGKKTADTATGSALAAKSDSEIEEDINMLMKNYFDAKQQVDMKELSECVSDVSHIEEKRLVAEANYIEEYKNMECTIRNDGLKEGAYRVYVYYEAKVYDIDTLVPSLTALYITADRNGKFKINLSAIDSEEKQAIEQLDNKPEIKKMISSVQKKLEDLVSKNKEVREFYQMLENSEDGEEDKDNTSEEGDTQPTAAPSAKE